MSVNFKFKVGDKIRKSSWEEGKYYQLKYVGCTYLVGNMFAANQITEETWLMRDCDVWQLYQEPKATKLVSPVVWMDGTMAGCTEKDMGHAKRWPARIVLKNLRWMDKDGNPVGGDENQLEGDLFFEVSK